MKHLNLYDEVKITNGEYKGTHGQVIYLEDEILTLVLPNGRRVEIDILDTNAKNIDDFDYLLTIPEYKRGAGVEYLERLLDAWGE